MGAPTVNIPVPAGMSFQRQAALFGLAAGLGILLGVTWRGDLARALYNGILQYFVDPQAQIGGLALAVGLGFLVGFIHTFHI